REPTILIARCLVENGPTPTSRQQPCINPSCINRSRRPAAGPIDQPLVPRYAEPRANRKHFLHSGLANLATNRAAGHADFGCEGAVEGADPIGLHTNHNGPKLNLGADLTAKGPLVLSRRK